MFKLKYLTAFFIMMALCVIIACDKSTDPDENYPFPDPIDSVATDITLNIFSCLNDSLLSTTVLDSEATITIDIPDTGLVITHGLNVLATADGFYTEFYYCHDGDSVTVDLDAVPEEANSITGVMIEIIDPYYYSYYGNLLIDLTGPEDFHYTTITDNRGRYGLGNLPPGDYTINLDDFYCPQSFDLTNTSATDYNDLKFIVEIPMRAPYIYLYPEQESDIDVHLQFTEGCALTQSEPPYGDGWHVHVTPDGVIDGRYNYLFYEGNLNHLPSLRSGWLIDGAHLESDISAMLASLGFVANEIADFNNYWIPRIEGHPYYAFFYVEPDSLVRLQINPTPANLLRALFVIHPLPQPVQITPPDLPAVNRDGFTVAEWGVLGWNE